LKAGANVNICMPDKRTALMFASTPAIVDLLIEAGADLHARHATGCNSLHMATACRHVDVMRRLLALGLHVNTTRVNGTTPLHIALGVRIYPMEISDTTPLHIASTAQTAAVSLLLESGADVNYADMSGCTPLHIASRACRCDSVNALLQAGAHADVISYVGTSPLSIAASFNRLDMLVSLLHAGANPNPIGHEGKAADVPLIHLLASYSEDRAAALACLEALLEYGADPCVTDTIGTCMTALMWTCKHANIQCVQRLLRAGADLHAVDTSGRNILAIMADYNLVVTDTVVMSLLAAGFDYTSL
jgi:ankyrin repeat protein